MGTTSSGDHYSTTRNKNKVTKVSADAISEACQHCESNVEIEVQKADKNESNAYTEYTAMCFCDIYHGFLQNSVCRLQGKPSATWTWRNETCTNACTAMVNMCRA